MCIIDISVWYKYFSTQNNVKIVEVFIFFQVLFPGPCWSL